MAQIAPVADRPIRFALVGCGRIAANHVQALGQHGSDCELMAVYDVDPAAAESMAERTAAKPWRNLEDMLAKSGADACILATPSGLHPGQAMQVAQAGKHVITEKPMATRWADGKRMVAACDEAGVRLFVVKQSRCSDTIRLLKRSLDKGRFGRIYTVALNVFWTRPQAYYDSSRWRGTWEFDGGALMNQASHYVDLLDWLIGPVESVQAFTATLGRNIEVEDTGVVALRWRNGALGTMNVTMLAWPKNFEGSITIIGERGTVRLGGFAADRVEHWQFESPDEEDDQLARSISSANAGVASGHGRYYENVIRVLRGEAEPETDGREGLKSLELLVGIYRSARDGRRVALPLEY